MIFLQWLEDKISEYERQSNVGQSVRDEQCELGYTWLCGLSLTHSAWMLSLFINQEAGNLTFKDTFPFKKSDSSASEKCQNQFDITSGW